MADRIIVYPGSIPQDSDLLFTNQNTMVDMGFALAAILGTGTFVNGLACAPTAPAGMTVNVAPGSIFSYQNLENSAYGSLPANTATQIVKQGVSKLTKNFACPAPTSSGQSIVYLIQAAFTETDGGATVLPYFNASNPATPYSGPTNSGTAQNTVRQGICSVTLKTGTAATTGSQANPAPDAGYTGLYTITVANGQTTITSANIVAVAGAPFIPNKLGSLAPLNSPAFAGIPTAPTPASADSSTTLATTAFVGSRTGSFLAFSSGATTVGATANNYFGLNAAVGSAALASFIIPFNYKISNFYGYAASTPTMGSRAYTIFINGSATSLTATATGTASTASDLTHSVTGVAGDQISVQIVTGGSDVVAHKASLMIQQIS